MHVSQPAMGLDLHTSALDAENRELRSELAELRSRESLRMQFLANISHDLRTPLTAIITHAEILREELLGPMSDRQRDSVGGIIAGGRQLLGMVSEILTYAQATANRLRVNASDFDLVNVVEQVFRISEAVSNRKELTMRCDIPADVPPMHADRDKITHVFTNLIGNAIEFTPKTGKVWVRAWHRVRDGNGEHVIEVGDTGIGIAPENQALVFEEFAQVDASPSRQHHGTGLGLTIARKFVELHGGQMWVESAVGVGSKFYFTIPSDSAAPADR